MNVNVLLSPIMILKYLKAAIIIITVFTGLKLYPQQVGVGQWREHLPYRKTIALAEADQKIYCATPYGIFYIDKSDNSLNRKSKINGLSDIGINHIVWNNKNKTLVVAYSNANIDLINNGRVINIGDIKRKSMPGNKTINRMIVKGDSVFLACGFGIVILDVKRQEITDTWYIGPQGSALNILDIDFNDSLIYAATTSGMYYASVSDPFLVSFTQWTKDTTLPHPNAAYNAVRSFGDFFIVNNSNQTYYSDTLYVLHSGAWSALSPEKTASRMNLRIMGDKLYVVFVDGVDVLDNNLQHYFTHWTYNPGWLTPMDAIIDKDSIVWIADSDVGLVKNHYPWIYEAIDIQGPYSPNVWALAASNNSMWIASGGVNTSWGNEWQREGVSAMINEKWHSWNYNNTPALDTIVDFLSIAINPLDENHVFVGSWGRGLLEFKNGKLNEVYSPQNSSIPYSVNDPKWFGVGGLTFDNEGNLWATSSAHPLALHRRSLKGEWRAYNLSPFVSEESLSQIIIDDYGQKWIVLARGQGLLVYDDNNTPENPIDDRKKKLDSRVGHGELPSTMVNCLALTHDGSVWVGTDEGIAVFYNPGNVFTNQNFDAQRIFIEQDGKTQYLLEFENVTAIAIDGANRKWIGTQKAGLFLMSEDGTKQIEHFTAENSPLLSNQINALSINHSTGEVFIGTDKGLISYRGTATRGEQSHSNVLVFPNPVRENYNGYISIKGLVDRADVKITDIQGGLVFSTTAHGGQAVWNGKKFNGHKVNTGIYLVFSSNSDGSETMVAKILFIQ